MARFGKKTKPQKIYRLDELKPMIQSGKPVLIDFMQVNCGPCRIMDGIVNELARDYGDSAHIVKVDVAKVPGAAQAFNVRSTPTFVLLGRAAKKQSRKAERRGKSQPKGAAKMGARWRTTGLVKKDQLERVLEANGASKVGAAS